MRNASLEVFPHIAPHDDEAGLAELASAPTLG